MSGNEWREFLTWSFYLVEFSNNPDEHLRKFRNLLHKYNLPIKDMLTSTLIAESYIIDSFRIGIVK